MAAPFIERYTSYSSEQTLQDDALLTVVGIGVLVVLDEFANLDVEQLHEVDTDKIHVLTTVELKAKEETDKYAGDVTLFQETIKVVEPSLLMPEPPDATLLGVMEEVVDRKGYKDVGNNFHRVIFENRPEIALQSLPGLAGGIEVVVYDGPQGYPFKPAVSEEVDSAKWMQVGDYLSLKDARPASKELLTHAVRTGLLQLGLQEHRRGRTEPVFSQNFQFDRFYRARNQLHDVSKFVR